MAESRFKSYRKDINRIKNVNTIASRVYDFEEALQIIKTKIASSLEKTESVKKDDVVKDKEYLKREKQRIKKLIEDIVYDSDMQVRRPIYDLNSDNKETLYTREEFVDILVSELVGYSILEDAMVEDNGISDVYIMSWDKIYVEKNGKNEKYPKTFRSKKHYWEFIERLIRNAGKELNNGNKKIQDFELYGDRYCAVSDSVAVYDKSITIRKHSSNHIKLNQIIDGGTMSQDVADVVGTIILGECNLIYGGITGSGKTTTLRALLDYYVTKANKRMLVCEDTRELMPENDHTLELVSSKNKNVDLEVSLDDLIITALRLKPKYIVVGEVRGKEAKSAIEGAETGHSTIFSMHGGNTWNIINRLVTKYLEAMPSLSIDVVERIIGSAIDYIAIQDDIPGIGRRLTSLVEINYNFNTRRVDLNPIIKFNFQTGEFDMLNKLSMDKAEKMMRRGVKFDDIKHIVKFDKNKNEEN